MDTPKISVIIPVYNVEPYIARCAHALMDQTLDDLELIFVDDCSPDGSSSILSRLIEEYPRRKARTTIIRHDGNKGVAAARTTGMKAMTGEYMAHCDPDDIPTPDMYRKMYEAAKAADADIVSCTYLEVPGGKRPSGTTFSGDGLQSLQNSGYTYGLWDKIIRSAIIKAHDIYPYEGINYNEDLNVIVRALCYCSKVTSIDEPLYHHTVGRDGSICSGDYKRLLLEHSVPCMRKLDDFLDRFGRDAGQPDFSSRLTDPAKFWMKNALFNKADIELWCSLWPECRRIIPHIGSLSKKERILMTLLARSPKLLKHFLK